MSSSNLNQELSLFEAARRMGVPFIKEVKPQDKEVMAGGLRFHYLDWGNQDREPLLLLHGIAQQAHSWDFISLALSDRYHILALDARGHGDSQWAADGDYSLEAHQQDLDAFVEAMGLEGFILVGLSMGGRNGYVFASRRPEKVKALVIVDTEPEGTRQGSQRIRRFLTLPDELDSYKEFAQRIQKYSGRPSWLVYGSLKYIIRQLPNGKWTWKYDKAIHSPRSWPPNWPSERLWQCLKSIQCPTLVVRGANSDLFRPATMHRMLKVIPNGRGALVPGAGHLVPGDNPAGFLEALNPFLFSLD